MALSDMRYREKNIKVNMFFHSYKNNVKKKISVWTISFGQSRWRQCTKGMCRCDVTHRSLKCWRTGLTTLSPDLIVPADLYTM